MCTFCDLYVHKIYIHCSPGQQTLARFGCLTCTLDNQTCQLILFHLIGSINQTVMTLIHSVFSETETKPWCKLHWTSGAKRWSLFWKTSRNILNARFVSKPTTNPKLYHVYTHFAVSVWRIMQEPATNKESSVVQSVKPKSIYQKEIVSKVYRAVFSTTVCWVSLPFDGVVMVVIWLVLSVGNTTLRCTIALTVDGLCAQTVTTHTKC